MMSFTKVWNVLIIKKNQQVKDKMRETSNTKCKGKGSKNHTSEYLETYVQELGRFYSIKILMLFNRVYRFNTALIKNLDSLIHWYCWAHKDKKYHFVNRQKSCKGEI